MADGNDTAPSIRAAALEHITGPSRGGVTWLGGSALDIYLSPERFVRAVEARVGETREGRVARLHPEAGSFEIEAAEDERIWVNGKRITHHRLRHHDMIEFGESGPLSRFRLYGEGKPARKTLGEIFSNCIDYLRVSR